MDWSTSTLSLSTNYCDLCRACLCPCVEINEIAQLLIMQNSPNSDMSCCISSIASVLLDIPILFGLQITKKKYIDPFLFENTDLAEDDEYVFDIENQNENMVPLNWCAFYSLAACENCCSTICCGPKVSQANFPPIFAICLLTLYPLFICPLSCILRQAAKQKLFIQSESLFGTLIRSSFCIPCSLIQVRKTLEVNSNSKSYMHQPPLINRMM